jgi:hypothetical protein
MLAADDALEVGSGGQGHWTECDYPMEVVLSVGSTSAIRAALPF